MEWENIDKNWRKIDIECASVCVYVRKTDTEKGRKRMGAGEWMSKWMTERKLKKRRN